jgi:hypothetical protein
MARSKATAPTNWLQVNLVRVVRIHFLFVLAYAISVIYYYGWKLIPAITMRQRWTVAAVMLIIVTIIWYAARQNIGSKFYYKGLAFALIASDIVLAAFSVYTQRGMASRSVALFAVPIIVSTILMSRSALFATATLCTAAYSLAVIRYFTDFPSEGYQIEMYGDLVYYSAMFFIIAGLLWVLVRYQQE